MTHIAAYAYAVLTVGIIGFQVAVAAGAPVGDYTMGGRYEGALPRPLRVAAAVESLVLALFALVVLAHAGVMLSSWSGATGWMIWVALAFNAVGLMLNLITHSTRERAVWAPVAAMMLAACLVVAI